MPILRPPQIPDDAISIGTVTGLQARFANKKKPKRESSSVLHTLHGSDSDELLADALADKQQSLVRADGQPRFIAKDKLGEGSQGVVYRVEDRDCLRDVAVKVLSFAHTDPEEVSRFIHEAQVTAQLEHPGIVPVHDLGSLKDGTVYYSMKRVDGVSLQEHLNSRAGKPEFRFELLEMFVSVCQTIAFAHSRGVVHRDLKPRNIMVGPFGEVLVMDWGLAKVLDTPDVLRPATSLRGLPESDAYRTTKGTAIGTPAYMAPEQALGEVESLDRRCDIYSLGVILYEMVSGVPPYIRGDAQKVLLQVARGEWTRLDARPEGDALPKSLIAIVHRAMAFDRNARYATVEDLSRDMRAFLAGQAVSAYQESTFEHLLRVLHGHRRQLRLAALVAGGALLLGVALEIVSWRQSERAVNELRHAAELDEKSGRLEEAHTALDRLLALRANDHQALRDVQRVEEGQRIAAAQRALAGKRTEADNLISHGQSLENKGDLDSLRSAGESYMQALGLVPDDKAISLNYQEVTARRNALEVENKKEEDEAIRRRSAERLALSAQRAMNWGKPIAKNREERLTERRQLDEAIQFSNDPALRARLHVVEDDIDNLEREYAETEARANNFLDLAVNMSPANPTVRQTMAEFYVQRLLDAEDRGDINEAVVAEYRISNYDSEFHRFEDIVQGLCWALVPTGMPAITLWPLEENGERMLVPTGEGIALTPGKIERVKRGRYLAKNSAGVATALRFRRGQRYTVALKSFPPLPPGVIFVPAGQVMDDLGHALGDVTHFALAAHEVTCGEYLDFLNDPACLRLCDEAQRTGRLVLVPRDDRGALWRRGEDGRFRLTQSDEVASVIDPSWPLSNVSGSDANAYVRWRGEHDHLPWRLPTLSEWKLAAQGGDGRPFPWGLRADLGYCASNATVTSITWCASAVASHAHDRSVQGVMDLAGSVAELLCEQTVGGGGSHWLAVGGSYLDRQADNFRVTYRREVREDAVHAATGFRLALTLPPSW